MIIMIIITRSSPRAGRGAPPDGFIITVVYNDNIYNNSSL